VATELRIDLLKWQREVVQDKTRFKVICAGRRVGKTRYSLTELLLKANEPKKIDADTAVMFIAPTNKMAMDLAWDQFIYMANPVIQKVNVNDQEIRLNNGMKIKIRGSDKPDSLRGGKLYHVILDEFQDTKSQTWEYAVQPTLTDLRGSATFIGTPKPDATEFRRIYDLGQTENANWKSWHFTTYDNEMISREEIQMAKDTKSTAAFEQEYMASWDTTGANILRLEWFATAEAPRGQYSTYIAVDPAGYENVSGDDQKKKHLDYFAIAVVRVYDDGHWWVQKIDYGRWDVRESAVRVLMAIRNHKPICVGIEKGSLMRALMPYLTDLMRKNGLFAHIEAIPSGGQSKANRITYALQGLLEHGRITFNPKENWDELKREMLAFPSTRVHDDCFPAQTPIVTMNGIKPIVDVTTEDYVLTRNGYRKVLKAWCKGNKQVITRFGITATPEHRIWTENRGWVSLDSVSENDILLECQPLKETSCANQLNSMEGCTTGIPTQNSPIIGDTTHPMIHGKQHPECCTRIYGNSITEKSRKDTTSTMKMGTSTITKSRISSVYQAQHIKWNIEKKEAQGRNHQSISHILPQLDHLQMSGTKQKNVGHGQENKQNEVFCKIGQKSLASSVEQCSNQKSPKHQCAAKNASVSKETLLCESGIHQNQRMTLQKENKSQKDIVKYAEVSSFRQVGDHLSVDQNAEERKLEEKLENNIIPVYDLMVDDDHEFFAWGVLVHNCLDSLAMCAHLAETVYAKPDDTDTFEVIDEVCGF
jgi:hypothetical protein